MSDDITYEVWQDEKHLRAEVATLDAALLAAKTAESVFLGSKIQVFKCTREEITLPCQNEKDYPR